MLLRAVLHLNARTRSLARRVGALNTTLSPRRLVQSCQTGQEWYQLDNSPLVRGVESRPSAPTLVSEEANGECRIGRAMEPGDASRWGGQGADAHPDRSLRVLVVHNRYRSASPSGENRVVDQESIALSQAGHRVERFEALNDDIDEFGWVHKALLPARVIWSGSSARALSRVLERFHPDVVHVHNLFPLLSPSVMRACTLQRVPVVVTVHNYRIICSKGTLFRSGAICHDCVGRLPLPAIKNRCYAGSRFATAPVAIATAAHQRAWRTMPSAYIFISNAQRLEFSSLGLPSHRCFVKGNLVFPVPAKRLSEDLVVFIGRMTEEKGVRLLMEAWDGYLARSGGAAMRLALAGSGPLEDEASGWSSRRPSVDFFGFLSNERCMALLSRARAAIVPSQWPETFGLAVAEAMASAVPPVASAHGSFPELISHGHDGMLFPPGDANALAAVLKQIADYPGWFDELGENALRTYEQRFHPAANVRQLEDVYRFVVDRPAFFEAGRRRPPANHPRQAA
jgi:glycosyltransferase involved in cell wall biosynthesis